MRDDFCGAIISEAWTDKPECGREAVVVWVVVVVVPERGRC